jgi:type II secretory pathway component PulJ
LPKQRERFSAFTLAELLVTMSVVVLLVLLLTQLLNSAATTMTLGNKRMDADSQARQLLDRMAIDLDQMLKRSDVSYYVKTLGNTQPGNDQIAFFSVVPGYYPSGAPSPLSLVAYRVNSNPTFSSYNRLERLGKGLVWNGVSTDPSLAPMVFLPLTISSTWPYATNQNSDPAYEVIGPDIFRFEYYYLLNSNPSVGTANQLSAGPWSSTNTFSVKDVAAVVVAIAVIEPKSKVLLSNTDLATVAGTLTDFGGSNACATVNWQNPGELLRQWQCTLDSTTGFPRPAISSIRLYERYYYLNQ